MSKEEWVSVEDIPSSFMLRSIRINMLNSYITILFEKTNHSMPHLLLDE